MAKKKKPFQWECKELEDGRWGIFLCEEFWRWPDKPVLYGASKNRDSVQSTVDRMNDPKYWADDD